MSSVVDASVLVAAASDSGPEGVWAEDVLAGAGIVAPHLLLVEATNIVRRLERSRELTQLEATAAHRDIVRLDIDLLPFEPFASRVWELRQSITSYDAWYVAIAEAFDVPLATLDRRLAHASGPSCRFLTPG